MSAAPNLPLLIEPEQLQPHVANSAILVVDLSDLVSYAIGHVAGAIHLDYAAQNRAEPPTTGLLPDEARLSEVFSRIGLTPERHLVAYDDEGDDRAAPVAMDAGCASATNGRPCSTAAFVAWDVAKGPLEVQVSHPTPSSYQARFYNPEAIADKNYILARRSISPTWCCWTPARRPNSRVWWCAPSAAATFRARST